MGTIGWTKRGFIKLDDDPDSTPIVGPPKALRLLFSDNPGIDLDCAAAATVSITDDFQTFVMFRPHRGSPSENTFVTLGIVTWGWTATACNPFPVLPRWSISASNVTYPSFDNGDVFPEWEEVLVLDTEK